MSTSLIPDLKNIINTFLTPIEYITSISDNIINFNKKIFTQILENYQKIFPLDFYEEVHAEALKICTLFNKDRLDKYKLNPKYVASIIMTYIVKNDLISLKDITDYGAFIRCVYYHIEQRIAENQEIFHESYTYLVTKYISATNRSKITEGSNIIMEAIEILKDTDPDIYDTTLPENIFQKLDSSIDKLIDQRSYYKSKFN